MGLALLLPGATDRWAVEAYVEQVRAPALRPGQLVILDNLSSHHSARVQRLVAARACEVWFLPSYSPDLSPIEAAFAKLKQAWRKRTRARSTHCTTRSVPASRQLPMRMRVAFSPIAAIAPVVLQDNLMAIALDHLLIEQKISRCLPTWK